MNKNNAIRLWYDLCNVTYEQGASLTEFGKIVLSHDITTFRPDFEDDQKAAATFLRDWANAIEGIESKDKHHTMEELYEHRHALLGAFIKKHGGWKAKYH